MASDKPVKTVIKLQIPAGKANPAPPVGTALGPHGVNMQEFCSAFNNQTSQLGNVIVPCVITVYEDRTLSFITKQPPASFLVKQAAKIDKGSGEPHKNKVAKITKAELEEIAKIKMEDLNANDLEAAMKIMAGTARSMGVQIEG
ncbi:50S ribosomal protein L11 [Candidatus Peregrinibacteria bacterium]|jgi:large subunit ribosomal protein L11|nr:50S ribosomal protein L11 [Candidatus Peregrinibacteria bacterium]MBT4631338.1 50S ribosomal protein L11 [Candidatus Peregrinibacteria bacterium]MBT5516717.1 50S ribosomal protein L11 [Candidatus Peregrinibacteria bacterium]MBT5823787.1 50S ribosomal protein L11 [Candidatus Peregrinibacteria bacterium]